MIRAVDEASLECAADILRRGGLVAFPTETVYGLGGDAFNVSALARIFEVKGRPRFDPLIIHIASLDALEGVADLSPLPPPVRDRVYTLAGKLWPGPLTMILPKRGTIPDLATSGLATAALRLPDHPAARRLIQRSTGAVAAPSANPFGFLSPTRARHVEEQLGDRVDLILDGGPCRVGVESTVLDMTADPPRILRQGGVPGELIAGLIGTIVTDAGTGINTAAGAGAAPRSPGQLGGHYAPRTPLTLHRREEMIRLPPRPEEAYLFFEGRGRDAWREALRRGGEAAGDGAAGEDRVWTLSESGNLTEAAANLFEFLHVMDRLALRLIHAERAPETGLGPAINDRLGRAGWEKTSRAG
ncbi:MAG: threonylcarbamoyl-AMP synthase [Treponema sp.]|nr:threonylcarbamoyl-AMP synthase [Treponema sp.]